MGVWLSDSAARTWPNREAWFNRNPSGCFFPPPPPPPHFPPPPVVVEHHRRCLLATASQVSGLAPLPTLMSPHRAKPGWGRAQRRRLQPKPSPATTNMKAGCSTTSTTSTTTTSHAKAAGHITPTKRPPIANEATSPPTNHPSSRLHHVTAGTPLSIDRNHRETRRRRPLGNGVLGKWPSPLLHLVNPHQAKPGRG